MKTEISSIIDRYKKAKTSSEKGFVDKHIDNVEVTDAPGADSIDKAAKETKKYDRKKNRHGYDPGEDGSVYEAERITRKARVTKNGSMGKPKFGTASPYPNDQDMSNVEWDDGKVSVEKNTNLNVIRPVDEGYWDNHSGPSKHIKIKKNFSIINMIDEAIAETIDELNEEERAIVVEMFSEPDGYLEMIETLFAEDNYDDDNYDDDDDEEGKQQLNGKRDYPDNNTKKTDLNLANASSKKRDTHG